MNVELVKRLSVARYLFQLSVESLKSKNDAHLFACVNLLQDAVEAFLVACCDEMNVPTDPKIAFDQYFVRIKEKTGSELPFKQKLLRLNNARVASKHHGIQPAREECERFATSVREFLEVVSRERLNVSFFTVSAIDLLTDGEAKSLLKEATAQLDLGDYYACSELCRKALFLEIEKEYDVYGFRQGAPRQIMGPFSKAPYYARDAAYIEKRVTQPTEYIVFDHAELDRDLLKHGVSPTDFWNIWRLTPSVYRLEDRTWAISLTLDKAETLRQQDIAAYILATTLEIVIAVHTSKRRTRYATSSHFLIDLKSDGVAMHEKSSRDSPFKLSPPGERVLHAMSVLDGLDGRKYWWGWVGEFSNFMHGYVANDDVLAETLRPLSLADDSAGNA